MSQRTSRILVIDDERLIAELMRDVLLRHGFDVEMSTCGITGLDHAGRGGFDLVISDFAMPGLNGLDFARRLRQTSPHTRIVIVSAFLDGETVDALDAEPNVARLLRKPFDIFELVKTATECAARPHASTAASTPAAKSAARGDSGVLKMPSGVRRPRAEGGAR